MALCTRCGQQTERAAEFCSGCGSYLGSGGTDRPRAVAADSGSADYLRPFASRVRTGTALHPDDERTAWDEPDSGPQQWAGGPPDLPRRAADYGGNARYGTHGPQTGDPLTDERPDATDPSGGGFSLMPRGPFEPARPAYPQDESPEQQAGGYQPGPALPPEQRAEAAGQPDPDRYAPDSPPAGYPVADPQLADHDHSPAVGYPVADSPAAGSPGAGDQGGGGWLPLRFGPGDDPLTARIPPEYQTASRQYAPGPAVPAQRQPDAPDDVAAPYDPLAGYGQPAHPGAPQSASPDTGSRRSRPGPAGPPFPATDSADLEADEAPGRVLRSGRWITIAATAVVLIICAATAAILLLHGKPPATSGRAASHRRPAATTPPASTIRKPITVVPGAASGPDSPAVVTFLTRYFSAINRHDFAAYRRLFGTSLRGGLSQAAFTAGYGSTKDSQVTLHSITAPAAGQLIAKVTFTSHQLPAASPNNSACTAWNIALYLRQERGGLALVSPPAGYQATFRNC